MKDGFFCSSTHVLAPPLPSRAASPTLPPMNALYYGDNLHVLREHLQDESVDLVYLDPPFNSKRDYNLLFRTPKGDESDAQITAFEDTWHWGEQAEREFHDFPLIPRPVELRTAGVGVANC